MSSSSIIIPNYNGLSLLQRCIPSLLDALKHDGGAHEIIVHDNDFVCSPVVLQRIQQ